MSSPQSVKAGGMGVLGAVAHSPRALEIDIEWIEAEIGDRPYGVDLIIPAKYEGSDSGGVTTQQIIDAIPPEHRKFVDDLLESTRCRRCPRDPTCGR